MNQGFVCCLHHDGLFLDPEERGDMFIRKAGWLTNGLRTIQFFITITVRTPDSFSFTSRFENSPVADCSGLYAAFSSTIETSIAMWSRILFITQRKVRPPLPPPSPHHCKGHGTCSRVAHLSGLSRWRLPGPCLERPPLHHAFVCTPQFSCAHVPNFRYFYFPLSEQWRSTSVTKRFSARGLT
jgi:hypothetical protein